MIRRAVLLADLAEQSATILRMQSQPQLYCPKCAKPVTDPLICGDCSSLICRVCGTPLESSDELAIG